MIRVQALSACHESESTISLILIVFAVTVANIANALFLQRLQSSVKHFQFVVFDDLVAKSTSDQQFGHIVLWQVLLGAFAFRLIVAQSGLQ